MPKGVEKQKNTKKDATLSIKEKRKKKQEKKTQKSTQS